jgi:hypothetical protein
MAVRTAATTRSSTRPVGEDTRACRRVDELAITAAQLARRRGVLTSAWPL